VSYIGLSHLLSCLCSALGLGTEAWAWVILIMASLRQGERCITENTRKRQLLVHSMQRRRGCAGMLVSICLQNLEFQAQKAGRQLVVWAIAVGCLVVPWVWDDQSGWCKLCLCHAYLQQCCSHHHATFFSLVQVVYLIYLALAGVSKAVAGKAGVTTSLCHKRPSAACPDSPLPLCAVALVAPWVWALQ
jgi:hypothetical protein